MDEQLEFAKLIAARLRSAGIDYMLTGSVAMALYATPRMTRDIDIVIECSPDDVDTIVRLFESDCYIDREAVSVATKNRGMFNAIHTEWIIKADFIVRKDHPYRHVEFERRREIDVEGTRVWVVTPEDLILSKLAWAEQSGSEWQRRDAKEIIDSADELDWGYLDRWAQQLGVKQVLDEAGGR